MIFPDGYAQMYNTFTLPQVFEENKKKGLEKTVKELRAREKEDNEMLNYQRLKKHDDITVIRIVL